MNWNYRELAATLRAEMSSHPPVVVVEEIYSLDEKMGKTYIGRDVANTLAQRDYKQPQAVCYEENR